MDHAFREKLFRDRMQGHSEKSRFSGALFLGTAALFWLAVLSALVMMLAGGIAEISPWAALVAASAIPASFILGRRHARTLLRNL